MPGPWEKFSNTEQQAPVESQGPWSKFKGNSENESPVSVAPLPSKQKYIDTSDPVTREMAAYQEGGVGGALKDFLTKEIPAGVRSAGQTISSIPVVGPALGAVGTGLDYAIDAPYRAYAGEVLSHPDEPLTGAWEGTKSALAQYLKSPSEAPTMESLVQKAGVPEDYQDIAATAGSLMQPSAFIAPKIVPKAAGALTEGASKAATGFAERGAIRAAGPYLKDMREIMGKKRTASIADTMYKKDMVRPGSSFDTVAEESSKHLSDTGKKIGEIYDMVGDQNVVIDKPKFIQKLKDAVKKSEPKLGKDKYYAEMDSLIEEISKDPKLHDVRVLNDFMGAVDDRINYSRNPLTKAPDLEKGYTSLRSALRESTDEITDKVGKVFNNPDLGKNLKDLNKEYGNLKTINKVSKEKVIREESKEYMGLKPVAAGGLGATVGGAAAHTLGLDHATGAVLGGAAGLAIRPAQKYALPALAKGAKKASEILPQKLPSSLQSAIKHGTRAAAVTKGTKK